MSTRWTLLVVLIALAVPAMTRYNEEDVVADVWLETDVQELASNSMHVASASALLADPPAPPKVQDTKVSMPSKVEGGTVPAAPAAGAAEDAGASSSVADEDGEALPAPDYEKQDNVVSDAVVALNNNLISRKVEGDHRPPPDPLDVDYTRAKIVMAQASEEGRKMFALREKRMAAADQRGVVHEKQVEAREQKEHIKYRAERDRQVQRFQYKQVTALNRATAKFDEKEERSRAELKAGQANAALRAERALARGLQADKNRQELASKKEKAAEKRFEVDLSRGKRKVKEMEEKQRGEEKVQKKRLKTYQEIESRKKKIRAKRHKQNVKKEKQFKKTRKANFKKAEAKYKAENKKRKETISKMEKEELVEQAKDAKETIRLRKWLEKNRKTLERKMEAAKRTGKCPHGKCF